MNFTKMIRAMLFTPGLSGRWGLNILIEGKPGIAKSALIKKIATESGLNLEAIIASTRCPEDFAGMPVADLENKRLTRLPDRWIRSLIDADGGLAFLDEFSNTPNSVGAALLRLVNEGEAGDEHLPRRLRFIAAQNPAASSADGHDLSPAGANRWVHVSWTGPTVDEWSDWMLGGASDITETPVDARAEEARVMALWPEPFAKARGLVTSFIKAMPSELHNQPAESDPRSSKGWASHRSWEMVTRIIAGAEIHGLSEEEKQTLITGAVGEAAAIKLMQFSNDNDLPSPADILDGKIDFIPDHKLDRTIAVYNSCVALLTSQPEKMPARTPVMWKLLAKQVGVKTDLIVSAVRSLIIANVPDCAESKKVKIAIHPVLEAAGMLRR